MPLELAIAIVATATLTALGVGLLFGRSRADTEPAAYLDGYAAGYEDGHAEGMERAFSLERGEPLDGTVLDHAIGVVEQMRFGWEL